MVIGVLSDTHLDAPDQRLERLLSVVLDDAEVLLHVGDHTGDGVIEYLEHQQSRPYYGVAGNMDHGLLGRALPSRRVVRLGGCRIGMVHGWGAPGGLESRVLATFSSDVDVVVFGHSHQPMVRLSEGRWLVNPGSALHPRGTRLGSVAVLCLDGSRVSVEHRQTWRLARSG